MSTTVVPAPAVEPMAPTATAAPGFLARLLRRPLAAVCCAYLLALVVVAVVAPIAMPWVAHQQAGDLLASNQGPSAHHLLGTDTLGRDVLERLLVGTRVTLIGIAEGLGVSLLLGVPVGLLAGYLGGWVDRLVTWLADLVFSVPWIIIVIVVLAVFPESMLAGMSAFGLLVAPGLMRVVRSATLAVRGEAYVEAANVAGLSRTYIVTRHILPRISGAVIVQASLIAAAALATQAGLAFLNLLVAVPAPSWGGMVAEGTTVLLVHPWLIWPPGIAIALTMLALSLIGDAARDASVERWSQSAVPQRRLRARHAPARAAAAVRSHTLLAVEDLTVSFDARSSSTRVVDGVSFEIAPGEAVGLVGESGCGKTVTVNAILGLLPSGGRIERGTIAFDGGTLTGLGERGLRALRGREIALISQEPLASLNPTFRVGGQIAEAVRQHLGLSRAAAAERVHELLSQVRLPDPERVARRYPHELSGGMAQRVAIARALAGEPRLLIADEPTTALDVTVQAEILSLLVELQRRRGLSILLVTHDWGVVADICDRVTVMYAGQVVERAEALAMFDRPLHPYTSALLAANPHWATGTEQLPTIAGQVPRPGAWPSGCRFAPRCAYATAACSAEIELSEPHPRRLTRCIRHAELEVR